MKKLLSLLCCLTLMLSLSSIPVFAAETSTVSALSKTNTIQASVASQGLWYQENMWFINTYSFNVTPASGANLNIWIQNDNTVGVVVYKTNILGGYSQVYSNTFSAGERDVRVATNCNGKKFLVKFISAIDGSTISALVYQN